MDHDTVTKHFNSEDRNFNLLYFFFLSLIIFLHVNLYFFIYNIFVIMITINHVSYACTLSLSLSLECTYRLVRSGVRLEEGREEKINPLRCEICREEYHIGIEKQYVFSWKVCCSLSSLGKQTHINIPNYNNPLFFLTTLIIL